MRLLKYLVLFLTVTIILSSGCIGNKKTSEEWINEGKVLMQGNIDDEALEAFEKAIELDPQNVVAWLYKASALGELGRSEEALQAYDKAIEISPQEVYPLTSKAYYLRELGRYEEALQTYDQAIDLDPQSDDIQSDDIWIYKGNTFDEMSKSEEALQAYNKALELSPSDFNTWYYKADTLYELGRYEESLQAYEQVIVLFHGRLPSQEHGGAMYGAGNALKAMGRYDEAQVYYDMAREEGFQWDS